MNNRIENISRYDGHTNKPYHIMYPFYFYFLVDLKSIIEKYGNGVVLDIGCGNKPYEYMFSEKATKYIGCDVVQSDLRKVDIICEATNIPLDNNSFDTILCTQVVEHVSEPEKVFQEAYRLLNKKGIFIVSTNMYWQIHEAPHDYFRFTEYGIKFLLEKSGFEVVSIKENGGKWALFSQVFYYTVPKWLVYPKLIKFCLNKLFLWLDKTYPDKNNTINYVAVGRKV